MNNTILRLVPGLVLGAAVTGAAVVLERGEIALFGRAWLESLVLAILLGSLVRTVVPVPAACDAGVRFAAKAVLELAVMLLGASVSAAAIVAHGLPLLGGIALAVVLAIVFSYAVGRLLRLPHEMAVLVACGNSICGNSAIAAVAPVIDADGKDVASSIAFTAVLSVVVVLVLPLLDRVFALTPLQYGIFTGMTVYAVPQVLAAAAPVSQASLHIGTLVKLVRVLMLGPVVLGLSVFRRDGGRRRALPIAQLVPWFIVGFLVLMTLRSAGALPAAVLEPAHAASGWLTSMSMAALGLGVDARAVVRAGGKVTATVVVSLIGLGLISWGLIALLGIR
ncbi:YeiH family protein [Massilia putida]|uniref:YeiH family protein n=1 Tax=Massilia putida TaxID=1141883 RepID=UPI00095366D5|nr:putative sulfate exporter family transporter [Massilia putida]